MNNQPINSTPLNGFGFALAPGPAPVLPSAGFSWTVRVQVAGVDVSAALTGSIEVDREEGAAGVAGFSLFIYPGTAVVPTDWVNAAVTIDLSTTEAGATTERRLFTGFLAQPVWDSTSRILVCECSDNLQQRVEALGVATIDGLAGGYWSADVYEPVEGRSHWDYAQERLATVPASLDCSVTGGLRLSQWQAKAAAFVFGAGTTIYQSVSVDLAEAASVTNRIEIEFSYRYRRLWQHNKNYSWSTPEARGVGGILGFCEWRKNSHELPTKDMIAEAASSADETLLRPEYWELPPSMSDPCGTGVAWVNNQEGLLLGVDWVGARRWTQVITEKYPLVFWAPGGDVEGQAVVQRDSYTLDIETEAAKAWADEPILGGGKGATDEPDEAKRAEVFAVAAHKARTDLLAAHRRTTVSWSVPATSAAGIDLTHTLELDDQDVRALGKCRRIQHRLDLSGGEAIATLSIAVMRGGGVSDELIMPPRQGASSGGSGGGSVVPTNQLPTQLGGRVESPEYDDELPGFAGNYSSPAGWLESFPRRIDANADEIPAVDRDERVYEGAEYLYRVGVPNDQLELL